MKKIGMIVAVEINSVLNKFGSKLTSNKVVSGYKVLEYETNDYQLIIVNCGAGEIAASSATQFLISEYKVDLIVNFGVVGGLTEEMSKTKVCVVDKVVHYDFDTSMVDNVEVGRYLDYPSIYIPTTKELVDKSLEVEPDLKKVTCASGDKFIADPNKKIELNKLFKADICEMEAAGIVLTCNRNNIPCLLIKIVSDGIHGGSEEFTETKEMAASMCLEIVNEVINQI